MDATIAAKTISTRLAHVEHEHDLLAHSVVRLPQAYTYVSMIAMPDRASPYQVFRDAGQQLVRAICHLFEGVPADHGIAIHQTEVALRSRAKEGVAVEVTIRLEIDRDNPRHFLWQCESTIDFRQDGVPVAEAHIKCMTLPRTVGDPMMRRHHVRSPAIAA